MWLINGPLRLCSLGILYSRRQHEGVPFFPCFLLSSSHLMMRMMSRDRPGERLMEARPHVQQGGKKRKKQGLYQLGQKEPPGFRTSSGSPLSQIPSMWHQKQKRAPFLPFKNPTCTFLQFTRLSGKIYEYVRIA